MHTVEKAGRFGPFGGQYVPEMLIPAMQRLEKVALPILESDAFQQAYITQLQHYVGRPTALTFAPNLSEAYGASIYLKREDLAHTGAHKINNAIGQALLAKQLGARRVIAETGAGQHGVATAAACARLGLQCTIYMGAKDMARQHPNVQRMRIFGAGPAGRAATSRTGPARRAARRGDRPRGAPTAGHSSTAQRAHSALYSTVSRV